jgi:hypothetical protein
MQPRLLIINCPSEHFRYIPMGSFGLCDYLSRRDIDAKLLNLAVYEESGAEKVLTHYLDLFQPTHVALIFHWQETTGGFLWAGERIRSHNKKIEILAGGFTAGYFGKNLMERCGFLDYLIKGDPEKPVDLLLKSFDLPEIPGLIYRTPSGIIENPVSWKITPETLSNISFCNLSYLFDHGLYLQAIDKKLGFPVFIGRGCAFSCRYCGGSRRSFRSHSERTKPVARSIGSVIADLKKLREFTQKIYICYENDSDYVKSLFRAVKSERDLVQVFQLNYGAWRLPDKELLDLCKEVFIFPEDNKSVIELSPEVYDDRTRKRIKHAHIYYSIEDLKENLRIVKGCFNDRVNVSVFFSRYHDTAKTYSEMRMEIAGIFRLKHELFLDKITNARISYDHLSTDVAGSYWEKYVNRPRDFDTLVTEIRKLVTQEKFSFHFDNLCVYIPRTLSGRETLRCELLVFTLRLLERDFHEIFQVMMKCLDELFIGLMEKIITDEYCDRPYNIFVSLEPCELLDHIRHKVKEDKNIFSKIPFIEDLTEFCIKKAKAKRRTQTIKSLHQTERPKLNHAFISVHDHDYSDLYAFLKRPVIRDMANMGSEKTVFLFLVDEIISMPHETYNATLGEFEKGVISVDAYYQIMKRKGIFTLSYHRSLIAKLFQNDVLY